MIVKNGLVWNGRSFEKRTLYVEGNRFVEYTDLGPVVDATGLFVMPGFVDSHAHVMGTGLKMLTYDLEKVELEDVLSEANDKTFIVARGWEKLPANEILDRANSFDKPIFLIRKCGHVAWVNDHLK
ncbi:MAG: amidohydrolase family protein, partial [Candidatus Hydrothermia bacterium]